MSRKAKILRVGIALLGLFFVVGIAAVIVVQTDWFRNYVRQKIITATEEGTGGRVEIDSFSFSPRRLEAVVTNFVIHGKEPQGAAPFVRAARVQVNLRLFTSLRRVLDISYLGVERPQANVMVFADGTTNLPQPKDKPESETTVLDTVIDLAVDRFLISDGLFTFNSAPQPIDIRGNNLHAVLGFNTLTRSYKGEISLQPIYVAAGRNTPVVFTIALPVVLERTRVAFENARIATPESEIVINGSLEDLKNPKTTARVNGHLALADLKKLANLPLDLSARNIPTVIDIDGNAAVADNRITVSGLRLGAGKSSIEASGTLKDPQGNGSLEFKAALALEEVGRMASLDARPAGVVLANGTAKLDAANNYHLAGEIEGRNLSFSQDGRRFQNVNVHSAVAFDPHRLDLKGLRLSALGGQFNGNASIEEFARYSLTGSLRNFNLQTIMSALGQKPLPYDGSISGPIDAHGDLQSRGAKLAVASAKLEISPGRRGVPVSGRINAQYHGESGNVDVANSYLALPNTRLNLNGSLNNRLNLDLTSRNLNDLLAAAGPNPPPVKLEGGEARFNGYVTGGLTTPHLYGHIAVTRFSVETRRFDSLNADVDAANTRAAVSNGLLQRGTMQAQFAAAAGLDNWSPKPSQPLQATVNVRNGDLADVMVLAGQPSTGYGGALSADANIGGTLGNPTGRADLLALNGKIMDEPFDRIQARVNLSDQLITVPSASMTAGPSQVSLTAEFQHPRDSLTAGQLHAHVQSNQLNLEQIRTLQRERPNTGGALTLNADIRGSLAQNKIQGGEETEFSLTAIDADASARGLRFDGQNYGDATLKASTGGSTVHYDLTSNFAGSDIRVNGNTQLVKDYPTTADASLRSLSVERILAVAKQSEIPAKGVLSATAHFSGTLENPQGNADLDLVNAVVYDEPIDRVRARFTYVAERIDVPLFEVTAGPSRIQLTARFDHQPRDFEYGDLQFKIDSSQMDLVRIRNIQKVRPGLGGVLHIAAAGAAKVQKDAPQVLFQDLNADISATGVSAQGKNFGDLALKASTTAGRLNFTLNSNLANASLDGHGTAQLSGDYPLDAQLNFRNLAWSRMQPLLAESSGTPAFEVLAEGQVNLSGPVLKTNELRGSLRIPNLEFDSIPRAGSAEHKVTIRNQAPIAATLERGIIRIESAHLVGPQTDVSATGTVALVQAQTMDLRLKADTDIGLLQDFNRDIYSSGKVVLAASVNGTLAKPQVNGSLELQNASINYVDVPNGLSNANGSIVFNGTTATIRSLNAESGGGKVTLSGFVTYADVLRLGVRARATNVRIRPEGGVSVVVNAFLNITGTTEASLASGTVTINRVSYAPQSDFGSILTRAAPPLQAAGTPDPLLEHMRLDIRVRTSSSTAVQANMAENLQLDGDLRVRGTAARPGILGRLNITRGDLVFFGSKYTVSSGTIGFYDPLRIAPILNFSLETQAKGVNVVLNVTGPVDNMKLSYTSEPPLQFQEIVSLLASGKTPTSDPTLLANQPSQPSQNFQQMGESAIVSKALADPVASRLQRVFGISQLKIDPAFTSGSDLPQARVTLQQQVASNLTFTYVTALDDPNSQIVRVEWAFAPQWSAIANRDENGMFSVNLFYKKQFR